MARKRQAEQTKTPSEKKPPMHEVRIGRVRGVVWENNHAQQGIWYSVTFSRSYKDNDGQWRTATSFGRDDLLTVAEVARLTFLWIAAKGGARGVNETPINGVDEQGGSEIPI